MHKAKRQKLLPEEFLGMYDGWAGLVYEVGISVLLLCHHGILALFATLFIL